MMRTLVRALASLALVGIFVAGALAQTASLTITGANPDGYYLGGIYTNPYTFSITQNGFTTSPVLLSCDDFYNDVSLGESWNAYVTSLSSIENETTLNTTVYFPGGGQGVPDTLAAQKTGYEEIAYLASDLYYNASSDGYGNQAAADLSYAIWDIFDPTLLADNTQGLDATDLANALADVKMAQTFVADGGVVGSVLIYTPMCGSSPCTTSSPGAPQEFIQVLSPNQSLPEPSFIAMLLADLGFLAAMIFWRRRTAVTC